MDLERSPLLTDLYELTMLQSYYEYGMEQQAVFEFFIRPSQSRSFFIAAGLAQALDWLEHARFGAEELEWLAASGHFSDAFVERLRGWRFTGEVRALPEGTVFFPEEPLLQVFAPLPEAQLVESRLMNILHFQTLIATKAARCVHAAEGRLVVDFGLRRAHGGEAGLWAARACYLAGFGATATTLAGARYDIPVTGTMAHSFILAHDDETEAFERFARSHPDNVVLLIDTFDVIEGARKVVDLAARLARDNIRVKGVRIDSGDLAANARAVRDVLDAGGLTDTLVLLSGGLDEFRIADIVGTGAPADGFGVGSKVNTSADEPFLDSAYKLHHFSGRARAKHARGKSDLPGVKQIFRQHDAHGILALDTIGLDGDDEPGHALLETVMRDGQRLESASVATDLGGARTRAADELNRLPAACRRLTAPETVPVRLSDALGTLQRAT
ncbi:nicotinate phosphoribosyltransferase [Arhodomonas sp. AD133]|uniref:nicotinate phosphoribosyltransferase n=1 Tax=Arhodomonas sp. AD133 TaxID=3415009 RepID=UPI003EB8F4AD